MNSPRSTPNYHSKAPNPPDPIPTAAWADSELHNAHTHRKNLLNNCVKCGELSVELATALERARRVEAELTVIEERYNTALIELKTLAT